MSYEDHYETLLAEHYTWMFRMPFDEKVAEQRALLERAGLSQGQTAIDLGAGSGFQSMALVQMGFEQVTAVDTSPHLLKELQQRDHGDRITCLREDIRNVSAIISRPVDAALCMGDTLTHLGSVKEVEDLIADLAGGLKPGGKLVFSWRDLSNVPTGVNRFIPVNSDEDRIMMCFLEDQEQHVMVHDLIHVRTNDGWQLKRSAYPKIKLSAEDVRSAFTAHGLEVVSEFVERGMIVMTAQKAL
ncbi:class I SAM-dependent methyltransferase [Pseudovibrio denitrificans]|uniref:class I SAM-dependent methyltransferase n=1 Tax=Pseudovibrio denitrificans TaxID=258256 RepID=UPI0039BFA05A